MHTYLQESGGLRRTAPVQSPVPVGASDRLSGLQRFVVGFFVATLALVYVANLLPRQDPGSAEAAVPVSPGGVP